MRQMVSDCNSYFRIILLKNRNQSQLALRETFRFADYIFSHSVITYQLSPQAIMYVISVPHSKQTQYEQA